MASKVLPQWVTARGGIDACTSRLSKLLKPRLLLSSACRVVGAECEGLLRHRKTITCIATEITITDHTTRPPSLR